MITILSCVVLGLLIAPTEGQKKDPCLMHITCGTCIADSKDDCGWCSLPWQYKGGLQGGRCANAGKYRATCPGVVSTVDCIQGWKCNHTSQMCHMVGPGHGIPQSECYQDCGIVPPLPPSMPSGPTYLCNQTTYKCYKAPKGEHGFNKQVCAGICHKATPATPSAPTMPNTCKCNKANYTCHPVPPGTAGAVSCPICANQCQKQINYVCNIHTYQCQVTPNGGVNKIQCENECVKLYVCDTSDYTCKVSPPPAPGVPLAKCNGECKPGNNTPGYLIGLWRGIQINQGYQTGEWDINFDHDEIYVLGPNQEIFGGSTSFTGTPERRLIDVKITNSSDSLNAPVGSILQLWYEFDGATPETRFLMIASGPPNGEAPHTWEEAQYSQSGFDWTMAECEPLTHCQFHLRPGGQLKKKQVSNKIRTMAMIDEDHDTGLFKKHADPCTQYSTSCQVCLTHFVSTQCGWCSSPVVYPGGIKGGHCVQWNPSHNPFNCTGFRNYDCSDYECIQPQGCKKVPVGHGTNLTTCQATCHSILPPVPPSPPPPPPPGPELSVCNHTTWKCDPATPGQPNATSPFLCENSCKPETPQAPAAPSIPSSPTAPIPPQAPQPITLPWACNTTDYKCHQVQPGTHGASGKPICESQCYPPAPPPPPMFNGKYRGIQIDNHYHIGEFELVLVNGSYSLKMNQGSVSKGRVYISSNRGNLFVQEEEPNPGLYAAIYSVNPGISAEHITLVMGKDSTDIPSGWDLPWISGGKKGKEFIFHKFSNSTEE